MTDDWENLGSDNLPGKSAESPPSASRPRRRVPRPVFVALCTATVLLGALVLLVSVVPPPTPEPLPPPLPDEGLLADLRGEDTLHRLEITQAALQREMSVLRQWVFEGDEGSALSAQLDLARAVAELEAGQAHVRSRLAHLESDQVRLGEMIDACQIGLETQALRVGFQEQMLHEHLSEEGN